MRESVVEAYLATRVRAMGGMCVKLAPTVAGLPDRLVLLPEGRVYLVELKQPNGRVSPVQEAIQDKLGDLGFGVTVLWSKLDVTEWLRMISRKG